MTARNICSSLIGCFVVFISFSCTRQDIEFGSLPANNYTQLVYTDTVGIQFSTVLVDSFKTNATSNFLLGTFNDPYLGTTTGKPVFQMTVPGTTTEIPASAVFDSLTLEIRPNNYYYGDSTQPLTINIHELADPIVMSYGSQLYNTSPVALKPTLLGSVTKRVNPTGNDSILLRMTDSKGLELFNMLRRLSDTVSTEATFLNYLYGLSLSVSNNSSFIFGLTATVGNIVMRVHYHHTVPYPEAHSIAFTSVNNDYTYNQLLTNRNGNGLVSTGNNLSEIPLSQTNQLAFEQPGTGVYLKMTFPGLRSVIATDKIIRLLKAELIIRPAALSFNQGVTSLPNDIYLMTTDASNLAGSNVLDSLGSDILYASPVIDHLYGESNYYSLNVTSYINQLMNTAGTEASGFLVQHRPSVTDITRFVVGIPSNAALQSKLVLSLLVINK